MKKIFTLLILLFGVLGTLMAETYTQKVTVYAPATCTTTDIVFYGYKNKSDKSPYKTISGQPTSMYMNGLVLYKAEIPFNDVVYVKCTYKIKDSGDENSEFSNEITQTCSRYCGLDGVSSIPDPSAWYNTFDEAKYNQELFDLNYKANEGTLYVIYETKWAPAVSVYSSEYGEQYQTAISANTVAEFSLLGNSLFAYTVADYEVYDRVKYEYESTFTIDWNKPFYYDGVWYAKLSDIPIKNLLKEESCYYIHLVDKESLGNSCTCSIFPRKFTTYVNTALCVHNDKCSTCNAKTLCNFAREILITGSVNKIYLYALPCKRSYCS